MAPFPGLGFWIYQSRESKLSISIHCAASRSWHLDFPIMPDCEPSKGSLRFLTAAGKVVKAGVCVMYGGYG